MADFAHAETLPPAEIIEQAEEPVGRIELGVVLQRFTRARAELSRLCREIWAGNRRAWHWEIPANPERDSDILIGDALGDIPRLVAELGELRLQVERLGSGGVVRIARERLRQIDAEGYDTEHDDGHERGELAACAAQYALPAELRELGPSGVPLLWPWGACDWKPGDRIRELEKAGALIAAEIDRLERAEATRG